MTSVRAHNSHFPSNSLRIMERILIRKRRPRISCRIFHLLNVWGWHSVATRNFYVCGRVGHGGGSAHYLQPCLPISHCQTLPEFAVVSAIAQYQNGPVAVTVDHPAKCHPSQRQSTGACGSPASFVLRAKSEDIRGCICLLMHTQTRIGV